MYIKKTVKQPLPSIRLSKTEKLISSRNSPYAGESVKDTDV